jgi:hypothetical protein
MNFNAFFSSIIANDIFEQHKKIETHLPVVENSESKHYLKSYNPNNITTIDEGKKNNLVPNHQTKDSKNTKKEII